MSRKNKNQSPSSNNWNEYEKLVMSKLDSHDQAFSDVLKQIQAQTAHLSDFKLDVAKTIDAHKTTCEIAKEFPKFSRDIEGIKASLNNIRKSEKEISDHTKAIGEVRVDIAQLQIKSGLWGALGGLVSLIFIIVSISMKSGFSDFLKLITGK